MPKAHPFSRTLHLVGLKLCINLTLCSLPALRVATRNRHSQLLNLHFFTQCWFVCLFVVVCFLSLHGGHFPHISKQGKTMPFLKVWITFICTNKVIMYLRDTSPVFTLVVKTSRFQREHRVDFWISTHYVVCMSMKFSLILVFIIFFLICNSLQSILSPLHLCQL